MSDTQTISLDTVLAERDEAIRLLYEGFEAIDHYSVCGPNQARIRGQVATTWVHRTGAFLREHKAKVGLS